MEIRKDVENCLISIKNEWLTASCVFPDFLPEISEDTKAQNEQYAGKVSEDFQKHMSRLSRIPIGRKKWKQKMLTMLQEMLSQETIIGLHNSMDQKSIDTFYRELEDFLRHVRQFSPELTFDEIGQAIRNYIVYAMFKVINHVNSGFSNAGFGYSMLYPFTDNFIDSSKYSASEKLEYNQMIRNKIEGKEVHPKSKHQRKTCALLQAIESDYPRDIDASIFTLLLMMLEAQEESLRQQNNGVPLTEEEQLSISLFKGGVSVLIDRYLVNLALNETDLIFYLGFGFFLQLVDDLQDIKEDSLKGNQTIFTIKLAQEQEEKIVNKLLNFLHHIMDHYMADNDIFKNFVMSCSYQLIYSSVVGSKEFFTSTYLKQIENLLPVSCLFLENAKSNRIEKQDKRLQDNYMRVLDALICK